MNQETKNYEALRNINGDYDGDSMRILDSGERRRFESGAVRDIQEGKGRCDLLPMGEISDWFMNMKDRASGLSPESLKWANYASVMFYINIFMQTGDKHMIHSAIRQFAQSIWDEPFTPILELSKHYEEGAKKYSDRNWEKGIPCHCYIDSGLRHLTKFYRGDKDEPHDRAFLWNMFGLLWTLRYRPECNDLPCKEENTNLTDKEVEYVKNDVNTLIDICKDGGEIK